MRFTITADDRPARLALREFGRLTQEDLRVLGRETANAVRDTVKSLAPVSARPHRRGFQPGVYKASITAEESRTEKDVFIVFSQLPAALGALNLSQWLEFGTATMNAQPHFTPAEEQHRGPYAERVKRVLALAAQKAGRLS